MTKRKVDIIDDRLNDMEPQLAEAYHLYAKAQLEEWPRHEVLLWPDSIIKEGDKRRITYAEGDELHQVELLPLADKELVIDASAPDIQFIRIEDDPDAVVSVLLFEEQTYLWRLVRYSEPPKVYQTQLGNSALWQVVRDNF